jgi:hypothetical protein
MLDLFSGIGGFSYALKPIIKTVAYCEINPYCRYVLKERMRTGDICKGPIYNDVRMLTKENIKAPKMITAGFPCQDISVANPNGKGLEGNKSSLFYEIIKILDHFNSINVVFMENSSHILDNGFEQIKDVFLKRGFNIKYVLIRASDVGAHHKRLRWYCLAYKNADIFRQIDNKYIDFDWEKAMPLRKVVKIKSPSHKLELVERCRMLGNSIVPQCAMYAWNILTSNAVSTSVSTAYIFPIFKPQKPLKLVFTDGKTTIKKSQWATPVYSIWHNYTYLSDRGSRLLSNQTFYSSIPIAKQKENYNKYVANPEFVECLMGYPKNWTLIPDLVQLKSK